MKSHLRLAIDKFLATLPSDAPLHLVMASEPIRTHLADFDQADATAIAKQKHYRRVGRVALWTMTTSVVIGALALMPLEHWIAGRLSHIITALQTFALVIAVLAVVWISWRQPVDGWMKARAKAEAIRADVFRSIVRAPPGETDARVLLQQKFECFKRAHLNSQLEFFKRRGGEALQSRGRATPLRLAGYALTGLAVLFGLAAFLKFWSDADLPLWQPLLAAVQWFLVPDANRWQLGLGTVASSVLAFASARSLMDQDERNASCYAATVDLLKQVNDEDLANANTAASNGDEATVQVFCSRVQTVLSAENLSWMYARPPDDPRLI